MSQRPPESNDQQQWARSLELLTDPCSHTHTLNGTATPKDTSAISSSLQKAWAVSGKLCGLWWRAKVLLAGGEQEPQHWRQRALLGASSPAWKQIPVNPTAQEPYANTLFGFKALQAHLGLSRHANPALISIFCFSSPDLHCFSLHLLVQGPFPTLRTHGWWHEQSCPGHAAQQRSCSPWQSL